MPDTACFFVGFEYESCLGGDKIAHNKKKAAAETAKACAGNSAMLFIGFLHW